MPNLGLIDGSILKRRLRFNSKVVRVKLRVDSRMGHVSADYFCSLILFTFKKMHLGVMCKSIALKENFLGIRYRLGFVFIKIQID
jgi:hypothetical protein